MTPKIQHKAKGPEEIDLFGLLEIFKKRWYFVILTFIFAIVLSKLYLRYSQPIYEASTSLKVEDPNAALRSYGFIRDADNMSDNIQSEIEIIQSRRMIMEALSRMDFIDISYFTVGRVKTTEVYKNTPFKVIPDSGTSINTSIDYNLTFIDENDFELSFKTGESTPSVPVRYKLGEKVNMDGSVFRIIKWPTGLAPELDKSYQFKFTTVDMVAGKVSGGLKVEQMGFSGSLIKISLKNNVPQFATDFVNSLATVYVEYDIQNKRLAADQALEFIDSQIDSIKNSVETSSKAIENFKQVEDLTSIEEKISKETVKLNDFEKERNTIELSISSLKKVQKDLNAIPDKSGMTASFGTMMDPLIQSMVEAHNEYILQRNSLLETFEPGHPKIKQIEGKIDELKKNINSSLASSISQLENRTIFYDKLIDSTNKRRNLIPEIEHNYETLMREFAVKDNVLSTLLEKQADAAINRASIVPSVRVIDEAKTPAWPISPVSRNVMILGGGIGVSIGLIILVVSGLLKNTISFKEELESLSNIPVIGAVKRSSMSLKQKYPSILVMENPKSSLSESIRSIRTNLQFIGSDAHSKVISITSSVSGEGKSFISLNLSGIISMLGKKVILLDMDLRKPKLHYSFGKDNSLGLSTYLSGTSSLEDVILKTDFPNIDFISSGPIPPNPAELIQSAKAEALVEILKSKYEFVIIDTPPVGLVTDGVTLMKQSDVTLYVFRAEYSKKSYVNIPQRISEEQEISNIYMVLNSVSQTGGKYTGYGYKIYSSGYYSEDDDFVPKWKFWAKWFKRR